jgi:hypothetical protein
VAFCLSSYWRIQRSLVDGHPPKSPDSIPAFTVASPKLAADRVDAALIANAYHEMPAHEAILHHIRDALKQGGVIVVMERISDKREKESRDEQIKHHELAPQVVRQEVAGAGFEIVEVLILLLLRTLIAGYRETVAAGDTTDHGQYRLAILKWR